MAGPLEKLENAVKKLATDMANLRAETRSEFKDVRRELKSHGERLDDVTHALTGIQQTQTALTNAVTLAIKELAVTKSFDVRLSRLEAEVFGSKH